VTCFSLNAFAQQHGVLDGGSTTSPSALSRRLLEEKGLLGYFRWLVGG